MEQLAAIDCDPGTLRRAVERAALYSGEGDTYDEMFVRVRADRLETPGSAPGSSQASYCTFMATQFDDLSVSGTGPVDALFDVSSLLEWLDWLPTDSVTVRLEGENGVASRLVLGGRETTVELDCEADPAVLRSVETFLPTRFDGTTFHDEDGNPLPTRVETTAATLERLLDAVDNATDEGHYPLVVRDGRLTLDVIGERGTVRGPLPGDVSGPAVTNHYGSGFARVVHGLDGPVTLQTGPSDSVALVQDEEGYTLRFVVAHV